MWNDLWSKWELDSDESFTENDPWKKKKILKLKN